MARTSNNIRLHKGGLANSELGSHQTFDDRETRQKSRKNVDSLDLTGMDTLISNPKRVRGVSKSIFVDQDSKLSKFKSIRGHLNPFAQLAIKSKFYLNYLKLWNR